MLLLIAFLVNSLNIMNLFCKARDAKLVTFVDLRVEGRI